VTTPVEPITIVRTVDVEVDPSTAFEVFTAEIGLWYRSLPYAWNDPRRAIDIRFEPRVGGRWIEVWDAATGEGYEIGRLSVWEPGARLVTSYRNVTLPADAETELEVRFEPIATGTRVTLEHRGWERLSPAIVATWTARAWLAFVRGFAAYLAARAPA
jgi:uncharacterized protein YndB with AHSA1/START domain